jgi:predicted esterase
MVRTNAAKSHLKPNAIGMIGFSAGGHLASMTGMLASPGGRPDFLVLGYPAIPNVLAVNASTPRAFLVTADDDTTVNAAEMPAVLCRASRRQGARRAAYLFFR